MKLMVVRICEKGYSGGREGEKEGGREGGKEGGRNNKFHQLWIFHRSL